MARREPAGILGGPHSMKWTAAKYLLATPVQPTDVSGRTYRGLGLHQAGRGSPKGKRPPWWALTHLATGHRVCRIDAHEDEALKIATLIAECGDWTFEGLDGWKNSDPELKEKAAAMMQTFPGRISIGVAGHHTEIAHKIATVRAGGGHA